MSFVQIGALAEKVQTWDPRQSSDNREIDYIDIGSVSRETKSIELISKIRAKGAPSRARQLVRPGDILVSTVRPNLNAVAEVPLNLDGATASTGFTVLRPIRGKLDSKYLYYWVRTPEFIRKMLSRSTGANYPAVSDAIVKESTIPLPPLEEQKRIAAILDKADAIRKKRKQAIELTEKFLRSAFLDMFGDPITNPKGWDVSTINNIAEQVTDGEHQTPKRTSQGIKLLSARNVRDGHIDFGNVDYIGVKEHERIKRRCNPSRGDILISCSGTIGRVASVETDEPFSLVRSAALVRPKSTLISHKFLEHHLRTPALKAIMLRKANSSSQANLFQNKIRELPVFLPPIDLQNKFAHIAITAAKSTAMLESASSQLDMLFFSTQQRAFQGEL